MPTRLAPILLRRSPPACPELLGSLLHGGDPTLCTGATSFGAGRTLRNGAPMLPKPRGVSSDAVDVLGAVDDASSDAVDGLRERGGVWVSLLSPGRRASRSSLSLLRAAICPSSPSGRPWPTENLDVCASAYAELGSNSRFSSRENSTYSQVPGFSPCCCSPDAPASQLAAPVLGVFIGCRP